MAIQGWFQTHQRGYCHRTGQKKRGKINIEKFINCFDVDKLYLHTAYSILQHSKHQYDLYGRVDYNLNNIDAYKLLIEDIRRKDSFYNSYILINNVVYTVDDLFKEYDMFTNEVNGK